MGAIAVPPTSGEHPEHIRSFFPIAERYIFLNHAGVSPLPTPSLNAINAELTRANAACQWELEDRESALRSEVLALFARLIGASPDDVGFSTGTAYGICLLAAQIDWLSGDNVIGVQGDFPANVLPWKMLARRGVAYRSVAAVHGRVSVESIVEAVDERTRLVAVSHVQYSTGFRSDLDSIGSECRKRGVILAVDAIQSLGVLDTAVLSLPVDYVSAGAYKWMMGPTGLGFTYMHPSLRERISQAPSRGRFEGPGSGSVMMATPRAFDAVQPSAVSLVAARSSLAMILDIGVQRIESRILSLSTQLARSLAGLGFEVPRGTERESSGIVAFRVRNVPSAAVHAVLTEHRVVCRVHQGYVRLSVHYWNSPIDIDRLLDVLTKCFVGPSMVARSTT